MSTMKMKVGVEGIFRMRALSGGNIVRERTFRNLITNAGLDALGYLGARDLFGRCYVGTGTTPPAFTDTALEQPIANFYTIGSTGRSGATPPDYVTRSRYGFTFPQGDVVGNISEIGVGNVALFSRELIRDSNGDPVSFPMQENEQLVVDYFVNMHPVLVDTLSSMKLNPGTGAETSHDTTIRSRQVANVNFWGLQGKGGNSVSMAFSEGASGGNGSLVAPESNVNLPSNISFSATRDPYVPGSLKRTATFTSAPSAGSGTLAIIQVAASSSARWQIAYDPPITKTNEETLTLGFEFSWERYSP